MPRYFIEVSYKGTAYSGFQVQRNAVTIQSEVEKALQVFFRKAISLTGSSRTDAGVHALQNFFHFDIEEAIFQPQVQIYNLNAILAKDIVIKRIFQVEENVHSRFDAVSREYKYFIYRDKNPFLQDRAYFYPYQLDIEVLNAAAAILLKYQNFMSFSKRNTQVHNFLCTIERSEWKIEKDLLVYNVKANRFLRGMVKGLVGTMLRVGTNKISLSRFEEIIDARDCSYADFSVPPHGLFLIAVSYKNDG